MIYKFPSVAIGALSAVALVHTVIVGHAAVYFPYRGKSISSRFLLQSTSLRVFFVIASSSNDNTLLFSAPTAVDPLFCVFNDALLRVGRRVVFVAALLWATEGLHRHRSRNVHREAEYRAAFLALDAALFWLVCQMLTINATSDFMEEERSSCCSGS